MLTKLDYDITTEVQLRKQRTEAMFFTMKREVEGKVRWAASGRKLAACIRAIEEVIENIPS